MVCSRGSSFLGHRGVYSNQSYFCWQNLSEPYFFQCRECVRPMLPLPWCTGCIGGVLYSPQGYHYNLGSIRASLFQCIIFFWFPFAPDLCLPKCLQRYEAPAPKTSHTSGAQCPTFSYFVTKSRVTQIKGALAQTYATYLTASALPPQKKNHHVVFPNTTSVGEKCNALQKLTGNCNESSVHFLMDLLGKKSLSSANITFFKKFVTVWKTQCTCRSGGLACRKQVFPSSPGLPSAVSRHMSLCAER